MLRNPHRLLCSEYELLRTWVVLVLAIKQHSVHCSICSTMAVTSSSLNWKTWVALLVCCIEMWGAGQAPRRHGSIAGSNLHSHLSLGSNNMSRNPSGTIIQSGLPARHGLFMVVQQHHLRQSFSLRRTWRARTCRGGTQAVWSLVHGKVKFDSTVAIRKQRLFPGSG